MKQEKPIKQTNDRIRDWMPPLLKKDDKIIFPKEEFLRKSETF